MRDGKLFVGYVHAGFESDAYDGAGVTCMSIVIFCFHLSVAI